jgi:site-specific DNA-methyltransferase (adenine-specific)
MENKFILGDCMDKETGLPSYPDNYFDLAIVDPPYGIGMDGGNVGYKGANDFTKKTWDSSVPTVQYFKELFRVSKNQIIWGGNYFGLPPTRCFIIWDKGEGFYNRTYAEAELAWTSFDKNTVFAKRDPLARGDYRGKIHPTQKPIALYKWLVENYATPGDLICDTHTGSASSLIAYESLGFNYVAWEKDPDYYAAAKNRMSKGIQKDIFSQ